MDEKRKESAANQDKICDAELHDVLIAISVVAKRLAMKLEENQTNTGEK